MLLLEKRLILTLIRRKDVDFIEDAIKIAEDNKNSFGYTMVSFLCNNKSVLSVGVNSYSKTHPKQPQIKSYLLSTHAEVKCLSRHIVKRKRITPSMTLYIAGITKSHITNHCISSHPCKSCLQFITSCGIKRVVYATNDENGFNIREAIL